MVKINIDGNDVEMTVSEFVEYRMSVVKKSVDSLKSETSKIPFLPNPHPEPVTPKRKYNFSSIGRKGMLIGYFKNAKEKMCIECEGKFKRGPRDTDENWNRRKWCKIHRGEHEKHEYYITAPKKICSRCGNTFPKPYYSTSEQWKKATLCSECKGGKVLSKSSEKYTITKFPHLRTIRDDQMSVFESFVKQVIANATRLTFYGEGKIFGFDNRADWEAFVTEFMMLSGDIAKYFGASDNFYIRDAQNGMKEIIYKKEVANGTTV